MIILLRVFSQTGQPLPSSSSKGKERKGSEGHLGEYSRAWPQRLKHPAEQPILHQCLQLPPLCGVQGAQQQPGLPVPALSPCSDHGCRREDYRGDGLLPTVLENLKCQFVPWHVHRLAGAKATKHVPLHTLEHWKQTPCPFSAVRGPPFPAPGLAPLNTRTPQTGLTLKTSLFFGFFVCFEFIQSLKNLWFWLEI